MDCQPGSARPVVSSRIWSKAPFLCISFSIAATPASLIEQHRHPFANSRSSCDFSAVGSSSEEILMVLAMLIVSEEVHIVRIVTETFDALPTNV